MKLGVRENCLFEDVIDIDLSPSNLWDLIQLVKSDVLLCQNYGSQGIKRKLKDLLQERYDVWESKRNLKDA